jgi:hypothetical protein
MGDDILIRIQGHTIKDSEWMLAPQVRFVVVINHLIGGLTSLPKLSQGIKVTPCFEEFLLLKIFLNSLYL